MRGVTKDRGADPAATRAGEQPGIRVRVDDVQAAGDQLAPFFDDRHSPCPLALGGFVDQTARAGSGLTADRPDPSTRVNIARRMPDTSPMRAAVQAAKMTTSPQPAK